MNSKKPRNENKHACVDCHFLVELRYYDIPDDTDSDDPSHYGWSEVKRYEIDSNNRDKIRKNDYSWFKGLLGCYQECWEEKTQEMRDGRHNTVVKKDRNDCCFFFEYSPTMGFKTAEEMRDRRASSGVSRHQPKTKSIETITYNWDINDNREINCNGQIVTTLPRLQFELFKRLHKKAGKYVKNETLEKCWVGTKVERHNLTTTMGKINKELEEGLTHNNIKIKSRVIVPKKENKKNVAYKLIT